MSKAITPLQCFVEQRLKELDQNVVEIRSTQLFNNLCSKASEIITLGVCVSRGDYKIAIREAMIEKNNELSEAAAVANNTHQPARSTPATLVNRTTRSTTSTATTGRGTRAVSYSPRSPPWCDESTKGGTSTTYAIATLRLEPAPATPANARPLNSTSGAFKAFILVVSWGPLRGPSRLRLRPVE